MQYMILTQFFHHSFGNDISNFHNIQFTLINGGTELINTLSANYLIPNILIGVGNTWTINSIHITVAVTFKEAKSWSIDPTTSSSFVFSTLVQTVPTTKPTITPTEPPTETPSSSNDGSSSTPHSSMASPITSTSHLFMTLCSLFLLLIVINMY